jgi:glucose-6-phosphate 1-epimerase
MNMTELSVLNEHFGIQNQLTFSEGPGGLAVVEIVNSLAVATIALQGAHLLSWNPRGEQPVIWLSRDARFKAGQSIRGGVPVCWPWFGPHATQPSFPAHGFVRSVPWQVCERKRSKTVPRLLPFELCGLMSRTGSGRTHRNLSLV